MKFLRYLMIAAVFAAVACEPQDTGKKSDEDVTQQQGGENEGEQGGENGEEQGGASEQGEEEFAMAAVDLGLLVKWAACNIGATYKEEAGDYFAWGETAPKDGFTMGNYAFFDSDNKITKYNAKDGWGIVDNKTSLDLEDDAARAILKGNWRIPTVDDWNELKEHCIWTWEQVNGVKGYTVTALSGASIFLPGGSYKDGTSVHDNNSNQGWYWTADLSDGYPSTAKCLYIDHNFVDLTSSPLSRYLGLSIRAVCE